MRVDKQTIQQFRAEFQAQMKMLEARFGVKVSIGNINYNSSGFHTKMEVRNLDANTGEVMVNPRNEMAAQRAFAGKFGSGPIIGQNFYAWNTGLVRIVNFDTKKPKYPVIFVNEEGKQFKAPVSAIEGRA